MTTKARCLEYNQFGHPSYGTGSSPEESAACARMAAAMHANRKGNQVAYLRRRLVEARRAAANTSSRYHHDVVEKLEDELEELLLGG